MKAMDTSPHTFSPAWKVKLEPGTEKEEVNQYLSVSNAL